MFSRLWNLIKGMFGVFIGGLEARNPQAMIEAERDNINQQLVAFNEGLVNQAAMIEGMTRQIGETEKQIAQLTVHVTSYARTGDTATAGRLALQLQTAQQQLAELVQQRKAANTKLIELEHSRDSAFARVQEKMALLQKMVNETQMIDAQTKLDESAKGMVDATALSFNNMSRVEGKIATIRDQAAGRARIAAGQTNSTCSLQLYDETKKQLETEALQKFLAANGVGNNVAGANSGLPPVEKNLGSTELVSPSRI